jgi:hypothetical protein
MSLFSLQLNDIYAVEFFYLTDSHITERRR